MQALLEQIDTGGSGDNDHDTAPQAAVEAGTPAALAEDGLFGGGSSMSDWM